MKRNKNTAGFTLVELVVVIAILGILAGVGTVGYSGYIKSANMGNDKALVGNVMRALETSAYSYSNNFAVSGQYSEGLKVPAGFVIMSNEELEAPDGETGYTIAISNDTEADPIGKSLEAAFGADYGTSMKLSYGDWKVGAVGGSTLHNAAAGMMDKIDTTAGLMVALNRLNISALKLTEGDYEDGGDLIISVAGNITGKSKAEFVQAWLGATDTSYSSVGFGYAGRENYSAVRMAYNNSFAEYVRANYVGDGDKEDIADEIANYGQSAGDLAYEVVYDKTSNALVAWGAQQAANLAARDATFPYTANATAFNDPNYVGYNNQEIKDLYNEWLAGPARADAEMFYDIMVTSATDGAAYAEENGTNQFVDWFTEQANAYSENLNNVQSIVGDKSAIVLIAYYQNGLMEFEVYSSEANPRNAA